MKAESTALMAYSRRHSSPSSAHSGTRPASLADLREGEAGVVGEIDLPAAISRRLMELGFLPGVSVTAARSAPGGDPKVFRVEGAEIALRRETSARIFLKAAGS